MSRRRRDAPSQFHLPLPSDVEPWDDYMPRYHPSRPPHIEPSDDYLLDDYNLDDEYGDTSRNRSQSLDQFSRPLARRHSSEQPVEPVAPEFTQNLPTQNGSFSVRNESDEITVPSCQVNDPDVGYISETRALVGNQTGYEESVSSRVNTVLEDEVPDLNDTLDRLSYRHGSVPAQADAWNTLDANHIIEETSKSIYDPFTMWTAVEAANERVKEHVNLLANSSSVPPKEADAGVNHVENEYGGVTGLHSDYNRRTKFLREQHVGDLEDSKDLDVLSQGFSNEQSSEKLSVHSLEETLDKTSMHESNTYSWLKDFLPASSSANPLGDCKPSESVSRGEDISSQMDGTDVDGYEEATVLDGAPLESDAWSPVEEENLLLSINQEGPTNWDEVSDAIGSKSPRACRNHYFQFLKHNLSPSTVVDDTSKVIFGNLEEARLFLARRHTLMQRLIHFSRSRSLHLTMNHIIAGQSIDLPSLCLVVFSCRGHRIVSLQNKWREVAQKLQFDLIRAPSAPQQIKDFYEIHLTNFEDAQVEEVVHEHEIPVEAIAQAHQNRPRSYSESSQASSLPSITNSAFSIATASSMSSVINTLGAGDRLVTLLLENPVLRPMYQEAAAKVTLEKFERNLRRLLKLFAIDLRKEADTPRQRGAARFVRSRARNSAHIICRSLNSGDQKILGPKLPVVDFPQETIFEISDNSSDSDVQECELADLRELESFLVTSRAFEALRLNLRRLISPEESKAPIAQEALVTAAVEQAISDSPIHVPDKSPSGGFVQDVPELSCGDLVECPSSKAPSMVGESGYTCDQFLAESQNARMPSCLTMFALSLVLWPFFNFLLLNLGGIILEVTWRHQSTGALPFSLQNGIGWTSYLLGHEGLHLSPYEDTSWSHEVLDLNGIVFISSGWLALFAATPLAQLLRRKTVLWNKDLQRRTTLVANKWRIPRLEASGLKFENCETHVEHTSRSEMIAKSMLDSLATNRIGTDIISFLLSGVFTYLICVIYFGCIAEGKDCVYLDRFWQLSISSAIVLYALLASCYFRPRERKGSVELKPWPNTIVEEMGKWPRHYLNVLSSKVKTFQQKWAEYEYMLCISASAREFFNRKTGIPEGKTRVRWKCACGQNLYDDFTELKQGATQRLEDSLNRRDDGSNRSFRSRLSFKSFSSTVSTSIDSLKEAIRWRKAELPLHELQTDGNQRRNDSSTPPEEPIFLLLCHNEGVYAKKLLQLSICDLKSDKKLFAVLRSNYKQMRSRWWSFLSFRTLVGIKFVKFEMYKSALVDIREKDAIPPPERVGPHGEYHYTPTPPEIIPPVGENHLMHLFQHPTHAEDEPVCLDRFPKKLRERLAVCASAPTGLGWGLSLEEGWDCKKTWAVGFAIFMLGSAVWAVLWTVLERSVQDAFAVAAYMVSFALVTVGFTQAMVGGLK